MGYNFIWEWEFYKCLIFVCVEVMVYGGDMLVYGKEIS